ncbi:hypothetical protein TRFO_29550 [Tritrichomonas foetus]|uniref:Uncharacterized protein n=1 Tax=Tritrichomonas foetus TaxID=1144522 RepID=A0A1J4JVP9_9EUKA|nr:hypothetical protein TRFO_29550 [Tritrichomonas foetus]|eukprot:OHT03091.1 hypothetical protein TRFO_29550 [Tritrichomonas foetus]
MSLISFTILETSSIHNIDPNDDIRICVTAYPMREKLVHVVKGSNIANINHTFEIGNGKYLVSSLLVTFRRKSFINADPIIGRFEVDMKKIPTRKDNVMTFDLFPFINANETSFVQVTLKYPQVLTRIYVDVPDLMMMAQETPLVSNLSPEFSEFVINAQKRHRGFSEME